MGLAVELSPPTEDVSRKVWQLRENAERFAREPALKKLGWLYQIRDRVSRVAERWVRTSCEHMRVDFDSCVAGEYWTTGPGATLRMLRLLSLSLADIGDISSRYQKNTAAGRCAASVDHGRADSIADGSYHAWWR